MALGPLSGDDPAGRARAERGRPGAFRLVYVDECEVHRHPHLRRLWRRRGQVVRVPVAGEDARFTVYGAVEYASGAVLWRTRPTKDAATFVAFLDHLAAARPIGPIVVVLDNVGYHTAHLVQATLGYASAATTGRSLHARPTDSSARYLPL
jgi:DDE superfamily endonuclease